jgi:hypothetical protein
MRFSTQTAPKPQRLPQSLLVGFARVDMFKDVAVSDCLMMTGTISGLGVGSPPLCRGDDQSQISAGGG